MKKLRLLSVRMKFTLAIALILIILGIMVIASGIILFFITDKALSDLQPIADSYLSSVISTLQSVNSAISAAQPSLTSASEMTGQASTALTQVGSVAIDAGNSLNWLNLFGWRPFGSQADALLSTGNQIQGMVSELQTIGTSLSGTNVQLENIKASLSGIQGNLEVTKTQLPVYFSQAHMALLFITVGIPGVIGIIIILGGGAVLSIRREINKLCDKFVHLDRCQQAS